ncbi:glycosyltransferase family 49 protein [Backusella circina FSU 941]|nr:glycosyltransferase family 49 protein [Backusella circina FSU 941]
MNLTLQALATRKSVLILFLCILSGIAFVKYSTIEPVRRVTLYSASDLNQSIIISNQFEWTDINGGQHSLPIETVLSKSFSLSSYSDQSLIIPYYYKAEEDFEEKDITIVTLVTRNRIPNLARLATQYKGPISTTIHVSDDDEGEYTLDMLQQAMEQNPYMRQYVDVHVVRDEFDRELNLWRNVAKLFVRTEYVLLLDIDFYPCTDFRSNVLKNKEMMDLLESGSALVLPAFEYSKQENGLDYRKFPKDKSSLVKSYKESTIEMFHAFWTRGHGPTDYDRWMEADSVYQVTTYQHSYEPYVIFKNKGSPWCDERFAGYGSNKAACLFELYISGVDFHVLPNDYLIHQTHAYPNEARSIEQYYNRRLYTQFREELCIRLARRFISQKKWQDPKSENLRVECASIKPYQRAISKFRI